MSPDHDAHAGSPRTVSIQREAELGTLPALTPGTLVDRTASGGDVWRFICVGRPDPAIRAALGWRQENVWLRQTELDHIVSKRPNLMSSLPDAIAHVLLHPLSVHHNPQEIGTTYFIAEGESLRVAGLLQSRRVRLVDLVVERRPVLGGAFLRVLHFSPTGRNYGGRQVWP